MQLESEVKIIADIEKTISDSYIKLKEKRGLIEEEMEALEDLKLEEEMIKSRIEKEKDNLKKEKCKILFYFK